MGFAAAPSGNGYWIVSAAGGVYAYGAAGSFGSAAGQPYFAGQTAGGIAGTADGGGYYLVATGGGVYAFGNARYAGGGV